MMRIPRGEVLSSRPARHIARAVKSVPRGTRQAHELKSSHRPRVDDLYERDKSRTDLIRQYSISIATNTSATLSPLSFFVPILQQLFEREGFKWNPISNEMLAHGFHPV